uniref:Uncharacterized protein n=1 Tax=Anguilla anguilla TaxID=7936 RepID=A0A0E9WJC1_ANGAN
MPFFHDVVIAPELCSWSTIQEGFNAKARFSLTDFCTKVKKRY